MAQTLTPISKIPVLLLTDKVSYLFIGLSWKQRHPFEVNQLLKPLMNLSRLLRTGMLGTTQQ